MNTYKLRKTYPIPCARTRAHVYDDAGNCTDASPIFQDDEWWPLLGDAHTDTEIIQFPHEHYHIDWRFVNAWQLKRAKKIKTTASHELAIVLTTIFVVEIQTIPLRMKRPMPEYPLHIRFSKDLEEHYAHTIAKRHRCPHQGADLSTIAPNAQGQIVCPLHGLRFCAHTLKLIPTT